MRLWLLDCTDDEVAADPQLAIAAAWVYGLLGEGEKAQQFAVAAERGDLDVPSADGATSLRSSLAKPRPGSAPMESTRCLPTREFVYAAEKEPAETRWLLGGCRAIGIANVLLDRPDEAITALLEVLLLTSGQPRARM